MTSSGVAISLSIGADAKYPTKIIITPPTVAIAIAVCKALCASSYLLAPIHLPMTTLAPIDKPIKRFTRRLIKALVEPTAAKDSLPANLPTTTRSAALNRSCKILDNIKGMANRIILLKIEPSVISILLLFKMTPP